MKSIISIGLLFALLGVTSALHFDRPCRELEPVQNFNLTAYTGGWIERSHYIYNEAEEGRECTVSEYYPLTSNSISIVYSLLITETNTPVSINGWGFLSFPDEDVIEGRLNTTFAGPTFATQNNYNVIATNYEQYAVVWSCIENENGGSDELAFVLTRSHELPIEDEITLHAFIDKNLSVHDLVETIQDPSVCVQ